MSNDVVLFGAGNLGEAAYNLIKNERNISYYCDNDQNKWGKKINNVEVISPDHLKQLNNPKVIITTTTYDQEVANQLSTMGIKDVSALKWSIEDNIH